MTISEPNLYICKSRENKEADNNTGINNFKNKGDNEIDIIGLGQNFLLKH